MTASPLPETKQPRIQPYPLTPRNRLSLARAFQPVPRVDLTIDCVLEDQMGAAFVDALEAPAVFQIQGGPFFYLAGDIHSPAAQEFVDALPPYSFLMSAGPGWFELAQQTYGDRLRVLERYSFTSQNLSREHLSRMVAASPFRERLQRMDLSFAEKLWGQEHFVDLSMYASAADFVERGAGFYVAEGDTVAGAAYAQLVCSHGIEVSLYVDEPYRRQGMATALSASLLCWSLANGLQPHWDAANPESCQLALKLGYQPAGTYQAYFLFPPPKS